MAVTTRNTNTINAGLNSHVVVNQHMDNSRRVGVHGGARPVAERSGLGRGNVGARRGCGGNGHVAPCGNGHSALQPQFPYIQFSNIQGSVTFHGPVMFTVCPHQHQ